MSARTLVTLVAIPLLVLCGCSREKSDWRSAQAADTSESYEQFISEHPDSSLVTIGPGISGQPGSPFYGNLLQAWAGGEFFPLAYTRPAVDKVTAHTLVLKPAVRR